MKNILNIQNTQKMLIKNNKSKNNNKPEEIILKNNKVRAKSKRNSLSHKRNTTILSDNSFITISKEKKIYENNLNKKDDQNTVTLHNKKSTEINDSLNSLNNDYSNLNINEEIKNSENNINENNNNKNKDSEPDLFLFLNYTNNNFNYTVNGDVTIKKYNSMRNDYGKKKKTSVLLLTTHEHFNSAMNSFSESNSKENYNNEYDLESEYYNNCSINTLYKKNININNENDIILFNKTNDDSKSHKYFNNNLHNNTEKNAKTYNKNKLTNNSFVSKSFYIKEKNKNLPNNKEKLIPNGIKKFIKNKKKVYLNEISNCPLNTKMQNVLKENKNHNYIKSFNSKKDITVKINKIEKNANDSNENTKNKNSSKSKNIISNLKKKFNSFKLNFKNAKNDNKIDKIKNKDKDNNKDKDSIENNKDNNDSKNEEKTKKKIVVIKKRKNSKNKNDDEISLRSLTERNSEEKNIGDILENKEAEAKDKKDINKKNEDDLKIFEIISDAKIKSMIEYEKEKDNIKLLKENFNVNIDHTNKKENNNKYMDCLDEYSILLKKNNSRDTFSFRPTNNDSREISEQELKNNNDNGNNNKILLEVEGDNMKNEEKHRIKIIKKKKKFIK